MAKVIGVLGDNISTKRIYPTLWRIVTNPDKTPKYAFADDIGLNIGDTDFDDELEIDSFKVINKTKNIEYPIKP